MPLPQVVRYQVAHLHGGPSVHIGLRTGDEVAELRGVSSLAQLWRLSAAELRTRLATAQLGHALPLSDVVLLAPVDGSTEVWACGVTYRVSREARVEESERAADVYQLVYDADRPELFFKSVAWRVRGCGQPIGIRADSEVDVPEPELALVVNAFGEIVGYTICNDVSSRTIEGENPLYLPQAKIFFGGCALGPWITPAWAVPDPYDLDIELAITRDARIAWQNRTSTSLLHRRLEDLVEYLMRGDVHPDGVILSTGTCLVPEAPFTLRDGDIVDITIASIGTLTNPASGLATRDAGQARNRTRQAVQRTFPFALNTQTIVSVRGSHPRPWANSSHVAIQRIKDPIWIVGYEAIDAT